MVVSELEFSRCASKQVYYCSSTAVNACWLLERMDGRLVYPHVCPACQDWHLTSQEPSPSDVARWARRATAERHEEVGVESFGWLTERAGAETGHLPGSASSEKMTVHPPPA